MKSRILKLLVLIGVSGFLTACASQSTPEYSKGRYKVGSPYTIKGQTYYPQETYTHTETGLASWYGPGFHGKKTANGETFDENALTAAHRTLQMPSLVRVTNLENGRSIIVRVTDRGPFHGNRIIDLSKAAARELDMLRSGTAKVQIQVLEAESMALSEAARLKIDTRGAEIAVNNTGYLDERFAAFYPHTMMKAQPSPDILVASNDYLINDAYAPRPPQQPVAQPWPPLAADITADVASLEPAANNDMPIPPNLPPERRNLGATVPVMVRAKPQYTGDHPAIPVATLSPEDIAPTTSYNAGSVRAQVIPVKPTSIYVQAGSYTSPSGAQRAVSEISDIGPTKVIQASLGGKPYYRVRIGPMNDVQSADAIVNVLQRRGRQASIVVAEN